MPVGTTGCTTVNKSVYTLQPVVPTLLCQPVVPTGCANRLQSVYAMLEVPLAEFRELVWSQGLGRKGREKEGRKKRREKFSEIELLGQPVVPTSCKVYTLF